jgi:hypothetical protein
MWHVWISNRICPPHMYNHVRKQKFNKVTGFEWEQGSMIFRQIIFFLDNAMFKWKASICCIDMFKWKYQSVVKACLNEVIHKSFRQWYYRVKAYTCC